MRLVLVLFLILTACRGRRDNPFRPAPPPAPDCTTENAQLANTLSKFRDRPHERYWWFGHHYVAYRCDDSTTCPEMNE